MEQAELVEKLKRQGYRIGTAFGRTDGVVLLRINEVMIRASDAEKLAEGKVTLDQLIGPAENYIPPEVRSDILPH